MPANHCTPHTAEAKSKISAAKRGKAAPWKHRETKEVDGVTLYRCGRCSGFFSLNGFYRNRRTLLGITSECKKCHTRTSIISRDPNKARDRNAAYMARARASDPERFRAREREASRRREVNERTAARSTLNAAVRAGKVQRPASCEDCGGNRRLHGHHDDYAQPLRVRWLCPQCHANVHRAAGRTWDQFPEAGNA